MASRSLIDSTLLPAQPMRLAAPNVGGPGRGRVALALISWPLWIVMALIGVALLVAMLAMELVLLAEEAIRPGAPRKRFRIGALF